MKTPKQITADAAQRVIDTNGLDQGDGEDPIAALGWAMGGQIEYEDALTQFAAAALEADEKAGGPGELIPEGRTTMTDYEYDEDLPYVVTGAEGAVLARFRYPDLAEDCMAGYPIIDTTPKPRVPEDAKFVTWLEGGNTRWYAERRDGMWVLDVGDEAVDIDRFSGVTPDTVFTVLEERESDD